MDRVYRIVINSYGQFVPVGRLYTDLSSARNAYSNLAKGFSHPSTKGDVEGRILENGTLWSVRDDIRVGSPPPWLDARLIRARRLRDRSADLLAEAQRLERAAG